VFGIYVGIIRAPSKQKGNFCKLNLNPHKKIFSHQKLIDFNKFIFTFTDNGRVIIIFRFIDLVVDVFVIGVRVELWHDHNRHSREEKEKMEVIQHHYGFFDKEEVLKRKVWVMTRSIKDAAGWGRRRKNWNNRSDQSSEKKHE